MILLIVAAAGTISHSTCLSHYDCFFVYQVYSNWYHQVCSIWYVLIYEFTPATDTHVFEGLLFIIIVEIRPVSVIRITTLRWLDRYFAHIHTKWLSSSR